MSLKYHLGCRQHSASVEQKDLKHHKDVGDALIDSQTCLNLLIILILFGFQEILEQLDAFARRVDEQPRPENLSHAFPQALVINVHP